MGFLRYSDVELRDLLLRAVRIRWPEEDLLILTRCRIAPTAEPPTEGAGPAGAEGTGWGTGDGVLAVTPRRLIYQERTTRAVLAKSAAALLGAIAVLPLFLGGGLLTFAATAVAALALWTVGALAEFLTVGHGSIDFQQVHDLDPVGQRIGCAERSGRVRRLFVPDRSDFGMIAAMVGGAMA